MKRLPVGAYLLPPALAFAVMGIIVYRSSAEADAMLEQRAAEIARLEGQVRTLMARADSLELAADSLGRIARRSADTVLVHVDRFRDVAARLRRQLDSLEAHVPDTASAISRLRLADVRLAIRHGDSLAEACTRLAGDCDRALAAKDSALAAHAAAAQLQERRARELEEYSASLAGRLRSAERQRWLWGLGGAGLSLAMCWAAN